MAWLLVCAMVIPGWAYTPFVAQAAPLPDAHQGRIPAPYAADSDLTPGTMTPWVQPTFQVSASSSRYPNFLCTGLTCPTVSNSGNVVDSNTSNFATITFPLISVFSSAQIRVTESDDTYSAGTYTGFTLAKNSGLLSVSFFNNVSIRTYLDGVLQESKSGSSLLDVGILGLIDSGNKFEAGFWTTKPFDAVEYYVSQPIGVNLGASLRVYNAVLQKPVTAVSCSATVGTAAPPLAVGTASPWPTFTSGAKFVKQNATGNGSGSSWDNALGASGLENAIEAGGTVYVAAGTYAAANSISLSNNSTGHFVYGGFPANATGTNLSGYDPTANPTIVSGSGVRRIFHMTSATDNITLQGLILENGNAAPGSAFKAELGNTRAINYKFIDLVVRNNQSHGYGAFYLASITNTNSQILFLNSTFANNTAAYGSAIVASTVYPGTSSNNVVNAGRYVIDGVSFVNNSASIYGGVLKFTTSHTWNIRNSSFCGNDADHNGGAIYFTTSFQNNITNSSFSNNSTDGGGGAIHGTTATVDIDGTYFVGNTAGTSQQGGAIYGTTATYEITDSYFYNNRAGAGGAIFSTTAFGGLRSKAENSVFSGNQVSYTGTSFGVSQGVGGAAALVANANGWDFINSKFVNNSAPSSSWGGAIANYDLEVSITGSLFFGNTVGGSTTTTGSDIRNYDNAGGFFQIQNSKMQLANAGAYTNRIGSTDSSSYAFGTGNTFFNTDNGSIPPAPTITCPTGLPTESGTGAPVVNMCPALTVDLNNLHIGTVPATATLVWSTDGDPSDGISSQSPATTNVGGTYFAYYFDAASQCYSPPSVAVVVQTYICQGATDSDGDGVPDINDLDNDGDGISDAIEESVGGGDTDGDGIPNRFDLDSDNDGINDVLEAGGLTDANGDGRADGTDANNDGIIDNPATAPMDSDRDGTPDHSDLDSDNDGIPDLVEGGNGAADTNGDGVLNVNDSNGGDSDGDGIANSVDGLNGFGDAGSPALTDSDNDGLPNLVEPNNRDTDGDGAFDNNDADDDNDGIPTRDEGGADGIVNDDDADGDGIPNHLDRGNGTGGNSGDSDGDGIPDNVECPTGNPCPDSDRDRQPDYLDTDSDNDGISDQTEGSADTDGDGLANRLEPNNRDTDGDGNTDNNDANDDGDSVNTRDEGGADGIVYNDDADGDSIPDHLDASNGTGGDSGDSDGDGIPDLIECGGGLLPDFPDSDGDGQPDYMDPDSDNDGIPDATEGTADTDGDGLPDRLEPNNRDTDDDGNFDHNDADDDGDGIPTRDEGGADGIVNDDDADGDGIPDHLDSSNGTGGGSGDSDGDGIDDATECPTGNPCTDSDNDGTPDYQDEDSDDDGFTDEDENNNGTDPTDPNSIPGVAVSAKVLLQGALINPNNPSTPLSIMRDDIRSRNLLPLTSPYTGTAVVTATTALFAANGNDSVVDWVQLELRNATTPSTIVATLAALVQRDGDVIDATGSTTLVFRGVPTGSYFVAVTHRNHLGAMTAAPVSLSGTATLVDFTNTAADFFNAVANLNGFEQATIGGKFALWTGDANGDGRVAFSGQNNDVDAIFTAIDQAPGNLLGVPTFILNGYLGTDVDLTGSTIFSGEDVNTIFNTIDGHPRNLFGLPTYVIAEQLP